MTDWVRRAWTCLMYHDVLCSGRDESAHLPAFGVHSGTFRQHLGWLADSGLRGCTVGEAMAAGGPRVAVTLDDGTCDHFENAFPILRDFGMSATFYVVVGAVGRPGYASWDQLRAMRDGGMSIQSHSMTHPFLSELSPDQLWHELAESRRELNERLGQDTTEIALPGGDADRRVFHLIRDAGYRVVATSRWGRNRAASHADVVRVRRCTIRGQPSRAWFTNLVNGHPLLYARQRSREVVLGGLRRALGPSRYARLRRRALGVREPERRLSEG